MMGGGQGRGALGEIGFAGLDFRTLNITPVLLALLGGLSCV